MMMKLQMACLDHTCLAVISWASSLKKDESYYPQVFLKECKYIEKEVLSKHVTEALLVNWNLI